MPEKRLLYLTSQRLQAFAWNAGVLARDRVFEPGERGTADFSAYVTESPRSLYYFVADVVEEDFVQENLPYVRGRDRRLLLARKLSQRYRDTSLALALGVGTQHEARREERILFSSFTNTQQFQPWLAVLKSSLARLAGVYSPALLAPLLAKRIGAATPRFVLMTVQESGLRQSYVENGQIRFSRLGRAEGGGPRAAAETCAAESARIQQYLVNSRILPREAGPLDIVVLVPAAQRHAYASACTDNSRLRFRLVEIEAACRSIGLKSAPGDALCERLFLHVLAQTPPRLQFASDALRRGYHAWLARLILLWSGAAVGAACLLASGMNLLDLYEVHERAIQDAQQEAIAARQYARLQATFPKTPLSRDDLKQAVLTFDAVKRQTALPGKFLAEISAALAAVPQVELEKLDWTLDKGTHASAAAPRRDPAATPARPVAGAVEVAEISARINGVPSADYRGIKAVVAQFADALRQRPGVEIAATRLPFDFLTDKAVAGDVSEEERGEAPRFTITVARRAGS